MIPSCWHFARSLITSLPLSGKSRVTRIPPSTRVWTFFTSAGKVIVVFSVNLRLTSAANRRTLALRYCGVLLSPCVAHHVGGWNLYLLFALVSLWRCHLSRNEPSRASHLRMSHIWLRIPHKAKIDVRWGYHTLDNGTLFLSINYKRKVDHFRQAASVNSFSARAMYLLIIRCATPIIRPISSCVKPY